MVKLPVISGKELIKILENLSFQIVHQKGSHKYLQKGKYKTCVPLHKELAKGTLLAILKQCGLTREDLINLHYKK